MSHPREPVFIVHGLAQAVAALTAASEAEQPAWLCSGGYLAWSSFRVLGALAQEAVPAAQARLLFDPAARGGIAAEALAQGAEALLFPRRHPQRALLENLAAGRGARIFATSGGACDLAGAADPLRAARAWLLQRR